MAKRQSCEPHPAVRPASYSFIPDATAAGLHANPSVLSVRTEGAGRTVTLSGAEYERLRRADAAVAIARTILQRLRPGESPHPLFVQLAHQIALYDRAALDA